MELAWNPILFIPLKRSSTVIGRPANLLKSSSSTFCAPTGISFDGTRTASVTEDGSVPLELNVEAIFFGFISGIFFVANVANVGKKICKDLAKCR